MSGQQIVCVDDQPEVRDLLCELFADRGKRVHAFSEGTAALAHLREQAGNVSLVLLDLDLGEGVPDGLRVLRDLRSEFPELPTIMLTGKGTIETAVEAVKLGATDYIEKDTYLEDKIDISVGKLERMLTVLRERDELVASNRSLQRRVAELQRDETDRYTIVGRSDPIQKLLEAIVRTAPLPRPVLVLGERGTGKELVAHAIHRASTRTDGPFVVMNCAAITETLLESELFGHERGAFTGATQRKLGKFELADGGTLFLDEIGNMSSEFQTKILRVLEYQRFQRVAGTKEIEVNVRVIAATNANLQQAISQGTFRADLYDRLAFEVIELPPLRSRKEDIPVLATHFLERFGVEVGGLRCRRISDEALVALSGYDFPGNIRELKNIVERAAYSAVGEVVMASEIHAALPRQVIVAPAAEGGNFEDQVDAFQRQLLRAALRQHSWSQKEAAGALGLTYDQFRHMYRKYDLAKDKE